MAFTYTVDKRLPLGGGIFRVLGTYTNTGGSTGGAITTGLSSLNVYNSSCGVSQAATVNLMTASGGTITLTTVADEDGTWAAEGRL